MEGRKHMGFDVEILSVATANPKFRIAQHEIAGVAQNMRPDLKSMWSIFSHAGVETRYFSEPLDWCLQQHGWVERAQSFQRTALDLFEDVTLKTVANAGIALQDIDAIVTNTITGLAVPSLDAMLMHRLNLSQSIERLPIFGLGCGGGIGGLARATRVAQSMPNSTVLFLTVDLCSLCLRVTDESPAMFVSSALFGDGAAAVLLQNTVGKSRARSSRLPRICAIGEWSWRDTEQIMGWDIKDDGFGIVLSPELPALLEAQLAPVVHDFLGRNHMDLANIKGFLFHPGGAKVLVTIEQVLGIDHSRLVHSWEILRQFGNMSSATVLFVLERALQAGAVGPHLLTAFGPGFSAYLMVVDL
jgi:alkylresorcinol/alkylpyrone synthase